MELLVRQEWFLCVEEHESREKTDQRLVVSNQLTEAFGANLTSNQTRFFKVNIINGACGVHVMQVLIP